MMIRTKKLRELVHDYCVISERIKDKRANKTIVQFIEISPEIIDEELVFVSDLIKEIERQRDEGNCGKNCFSASLCLSSILKLCKSPEQNAGNLCKAHKHEDSGNGVRSVSGEQTGEDVKISCDMENTKENFNEDKTSPLCSGSSSPMLHRPDVREASSPVQNHSCIYCKKCGGKID
jgi:hypothetical protein